MALAASIVNVTIGGGIFRLPADGAGTLGATAPMAYLLCAAAMGLIVLCMAEAGSRVALTGGLYAYIEVAFGPFVGFLAGFLLWMVLTFAMAAVATVLVANLGALVPALSSRAVSAAVLVVIYTVFAVINIIGVQRGARVNTAITVAKLLPLLLLIVGGLFAIDPANLTAGEPPDMATLARSSILLIFVFAGIEAALVPGGEVRDPARTVPRAIFLAMGAVTLLYAGLQFVAQGVLGPALATSKAAPLADAAGVAIGGWARQLLLVGAIISMLGHAGGMILATPRTLFAFARDGFLPAALARVHPVHRTPVTAIVVQCSLVLVLAISSTFERLAILANLSTLIVYGLACIATWQLRRRDVRAGGVPFRVPMPGLVVVLALAVIGWMLTSVTREEWTALAVGMGAAALIFAFRRKP
ncbi:MAG TPA: amino acid permease [Vicinamibacterales bacterium]|nr:amino acid permease [Vicinamibacterales bacterium]